MGQVTKVRAAAQAVELPLGRILPGDCIAAMRGLPAASVDLVFADPPYKLETSELQDVLTELAANGWLAHDAVVVVERGKREPWEWPEGFAALRDRKYGEARLWYGHRHG